MNAQRKKKETLSKLKVFEEKSFVFLFYHSYHRFEDELLQFPTTWYHVQLTIGCSQTFTARPPRSIAWHTPAHTDAGDGRVLDLCGPAVFTQLHGAA